MDGTPEKFKCLVNVNKHTGLYLSCKYSYSKKKCRCSNCKKYKKQEKIKYMYSYEKWKIKNPNYYKNYAEKNKNYIAEKTRIWRKNNPERKAENVRQRKMLKKSVPTEKYLVSQIIELYGSNCYICNKKIDLNATRSTGKLGWQNGLHLDHVIPISRGGIDSIENIRPSHAICNLKKGSRERA